MLPSQIILQYFYKLLMWQILTGFNLSQLLKFFFFELITNITFYLLITI